MSILAPHFTPSATNDERPRPVGSRISSGMARMWSAHFDVDIYMALLMIMKVNVMMPLIWGHLRCVLLNVHCALHPGVDEVGQNIATIIMATNYIATKRAKKAMLPF